MVLKEFHFTHGRSILICEWNVYLVVFVRCLGEGAENAGLENVRTDIGYGKTIKPKQPTHLNSGVN